MDFNDANGNQSLVNRGSVSFTGQYVRQLLPSTVAFNYGTLGAVPSVNNGLGYAAVGATGQARGKIYLGNDITTPTRITQLDNLAALTLTGWINPGTNTGTVNLFDNSNANNGWRLDYNTSSNIFSFRDGSNSRNFAGSAWTTGSWQFFALVFDGSLALPADRFSLYSGDGVTLSSAINAFGNTALGANNGNLTTIGGSTQTFENNYFIGSLDSFRAYNTNETANLSAIMQSFDAIPEPSTYVLLVGGLVAVALMRRRRQRLNA